MTHLHRTADNFLRKFLESGKPVKIVYCLGNKVLGEYLIESVLQNTVLVTPSCKFQLPLFLPNPANESVDIGQSVTSSDLLITIYEQNSLGDRIPVYEIYFAISGESTDPNLSELI
jgi:hypothetical protein